MKEIYRTTGVYRITNTVNGRTYYGKTMMNFGDRWDSHKSSLRHNNHNNKNLQNDWNEYGEDSFEFAVVCICDTEEEANRIEKEYISKGKENDNVYNVSPGGNESWLKGKHLPEEIKKKIGEKNREHMTGKKLSEETRMKMSISQKIRAENESEEVKKSRAEKCSIANKGRKRSESTKEKLRKINQDNPPGAKLTPDDVRFIRKAKADGMKLVDLAEMFSTTPNYISTIVHRRRWSHIE